MKPFLLDVWTDLRNTRLWPVAAALLVAIFAVPVVLAKPAEEPPPAPSRASSEPKERPVALPDTDSAFALAASNLEEFSSKNPFKPLEQVAPKQEAPGGASGSTAAASSGFNTGGSTGSGGSGGSGGSTGASPAPVAPNTSSYTYVVDLTFSEPGKTRKVKRLPRFGMLPDEKSPLLVFLGVDSSGKKAVFLVDSQLEQTGEGSCKPSRKTCSFLTLTLNDDRDEHSFTDENGDAYALRLDAIRTARVGDSSASSGSAPSARAGRAERSFLAPPLVDLQTRGQATPALFKPASAGPR